MVERGRATRHGDTVFAEGSHRPARRELLDQDGRVPEGQHHDDVVGTADVGVRERHRTDVVAGDLERLTEAGAGGDECLVGVEHALGIRCRARGVVAPPDRRLAGRVLRRRRQGGGVASRQVFVAVDERRWRVEIRCHLGDHRAVVETAPVAGVQHELGLGLLDAEADFTVTVDVDDRVLDRAESAEREARDDGLHAGRQHPRDRRALADAEGMESGGDLLDLGDELGDGQRPTGIVDEQRMIGRRLVACGEQPPERGGVENRCGHARPLASAAP